MKRRILLILSCLLLALLVGGVFGIGYNSREPLTSYITITKEAPKPYPTVEKIVEVPVVETITEYEPVVLEDWASYDELKNWLVADNVSDMEFIENEFDCEDFMFMLIDHALADNKSIGMYVEKDWADMPFHAWNFAIVGNDVYRIEPQDDSLIWLTYKD